MKYWETDEVKAVLWLSRLAAGEPSSLGDSRVFVRAFTASPAECNSFATSYEQSSTLATSTSVDVKYTTHLINAV